MYFSLRLANEAFEVRVQLQSGKWSGVCDIMSRWALSSRAVLCHVVLCTNLQILRGDGSGPFRGRTFIGTDGHPVTFEDMLEVRIEAGGLTHGAVGGSCGGAGRAEGAGYTSRRALEWGEVPGTQG